MVNPVIIAVAYSKGFWENIGCSNELGVLQVKTPSQHRTLLDSFFVDLDLVRPSIRDHFSMWYLFSFFPLFYRGWLYEYTSSDLSTRVPQRKSFVGFTHSKNVSFPDRTIRPVYDRLWLQILDAKVRSINEAIRGCCRKGTASLALRNTGHNITFLILQLCDRNRQNHKVYLRCHTVEFWWFMMVCNHWTGNCYWPLSYQGLVRKTLSILKINGSLLAPATNNDSCNMDDIRRHLKEIGANKLYSVQNLHENICFYSQNDSLNGLREQKIYWET